MRCHRGRDKTLPKIPPPLPLARNVLLQTPKGDTHWRPRSPWTVALTLTLLLRLGSTLRVLPLVLPRIIVVPVPLLEERALIVCCCCCCCAAAPRFFVMFYANRISDSFGIGVRAACDVMLQSRVVQNGGCVCCSAVIVSWCTVLPIN